MCPMCAPRLQPRRLCCCAMHVNHARLTLNQMDAMPSQREGQGFESPKLHHCGLTQTLAMRDALEQGGTGTYPSSGVPCGAVFRSCLVDARVDNTPPVQAAWVKEVIEWLRQPIVDHLVDVEIQPVEEHFVKLSPHRIAGLPVSSCGLSSRSSAASMTPHPLLTTALGRPAHS